MYLRNEGHSLYCGIVKSANNSILKMVTRGRICNKITFLNSSVFVGFLIHFIHPTKAQNCELIKLLNVQQTKSTYAVKNTKEKLLKPKAAISCSKVCR